MAFFLPLSAARTALAVWIVAFVLCILASAERFNRCNAAAFGMCRESRSRQPKHGTCWRIWGTESRVSKRILSKPRRQTRRASPLSMTDVVETERMQTSSRTRKVAVKKRKKTRKSHNDSDDDDDDDAHSQFGMKRYWDETYTGMGDFPSEEYSWYYGWNVIKPHFVKYAAAETAGDARKILIPGVGNDPLLWDLLRFGNLTAFDYSANAIDRQYDLLGPLVMPPNLQLHVLDARALPAEWSNTFDVIVEKGTLDAIYLSHRSRTDNVERAARELFRVLKPGGVCLHISGVVPPLVRQSKLFSSSQWEWLRDGTSDLMAGCFVLRKLE